MATNYAEAMNEAFEQLKARIGRAKLTPMHRQTLESILPIMLQDLAADVKREPYASSAALTLERVLSYKNSITGSTGYLDQTPPDNVYGSVESRRAVDNAFDRLGVDLVKAHEQFKSRTQGMANGRGGI